MKNKYVVGFTGANQIIYGQDEDGEANYVEVMTLKEAREQLEELSDNAPKTIYKLVPVK